MENTIPLLIQKDKVFAAVIEQYGAPGFVTRPEGFESMCKTILEQQVSLASARASFYKLKDLVKDFIPENIIEDGEWVILEWKDPKEMRGCGFFHIKDGKIVFQRGYWDKLSFQRLYDIPLSIH